jgi:L-asparagine transporter-like permease
VAYEGFPLIINGVKDMENPDKNIPRAIYSAIFIVSLVYFIISLASVISIDKYDLIKNKEAALAVGMKSIVGEWGGILVIFSAILATTSAINSTLFGSSRKLSREAESRQWRNPFGELPSHSSSSALKAGLQRAVTAMLVFFQDVPKMVAVNPLRHSHGNQFGIFEETPAKNFPEIAP